MEEEWEKKKQEERLRKKLLLDLKGNLEVLRKNLPPFIPIGDETRLKAGMEASKKVHELSEILGIKDITFSGCALRDLDCFDKMIKKVEKELEKLEKTM